MAEYQTGQAILTDILSRSGELGIGSADLEAEAKRYIQASYIAVLAEPFPWPWGKKEPPGVLTTVAEYKTGKVAVTKDSTTITFDTTPTGLSFLNRKFFIENDPVVYRISTHTTGALTAALDSAYLGTTDAGATFRIFQDEYDLASDFLRPFGKKFLRDQLVSTSYQADLIGEDELSTRYPTPQVGTTVRYLALISEKRIRVAPYTEEARRFEYPYLFHPGVLTFDGTSADTLIIAPAEDRIVVAFYALANLCFDKDQMTKAQGFAMAGAAKLKDMKRLAMRFVKPRLWMRSQYRVSAWR